MAKHEQTPVSQIESRVFVFLPRVTGPTLVNDKKQGG